MLVSQRTYGNWRKINKVGFANLSMLASIIIFSIPLTGAFLQFILGIKGILLSVLIGLILLFLIFYKDLHDETILEKIISRIIYKYSKHKGYTMYRSGPLGKNKTKTYSLPALLASTKLLELSPNTNQGVIYNSSNKTYTVIFISEPDGLSLVDSNVFDNWVANWGNFLASLGNEPTIIGVQCTIETLPDSGANLTREINHTQIKGIPLADEMYKQINQTYANGSAIINSYISVTFKPSVYSKNKNNHDLALNEIATTIPNLLSALNGTGAGSCHVMTAYEICKMLRSAYDPQISIFYDDLETQGEFLQDYYYNAGPVSTESAWDSYLHDSGHSITFAMTQAPRGNVHANILSSLMSSSDIIPIKRVTLCYKPIESGKAATIVDKDVKDIDFRVNTSKRITARLRQEFTKILATADEEAQGAGLGDFTIFVTATAFKTQDLEDITSKINGLSASSRILLRPCYGYQEAGFQAALPVGVFLDNYSTIPSFIREGL